MDPEASKAANFGDFSTEVFVNGLVFSGEDFVGGGGGATGAESTIGLVGIGGGIVGEIPDMGTCVAPPMFRLRCISKSPTYQRAIYNQFQNKIMHEYLYANAAESLQLRVWKLTFNFSSATSVSSQTSSNSA